MHWRKQEKRDTVTMFLPVNYQDLLDFSALPTIRDICASGRLGLLIDDVSMFTADSLNELEGMRYVSDSYKCTSMTYSCTDTSLCLVAILVPTAIYLAYGCS